MTAARSRSPIPWAIAALLLLAASLTMRWPGVAMYDSVSQYEQALTNDYADWHPPIMARLWALLIHIHPGTEPFFLIQMALWWGGLGLLAAALGRQQRHGAAAAVLLVGIAPLWLGWATVVLKDAQMACCLVAATGIAAHWRLAGRAIPRWTAAAILLLVGYATLVRGNAVFATIPFALALFGWVGAKRPWLRAGLALGIAVAVVVLNPVLNQRVMQAENSHVSRALPLYDLVGIGHFAHLPSIPGLTPAQWAEAERRGCYTPYFWNPYGEDTQCGFVGDRLIFDDNIGRHLMVDWAGQVARHPIAYAEHRLGQLNATERLWVDADEPDAIPPSESEPNDDGLGAPPTTAGQGLVTAAGLMVKSPLGWPIVWVTAAAGLLWASRGWNGAQERLARILALSAITMEASFAVVSIASDLRYHLWTMIAAALALVLIVDSGAYERRRMAILGGLVLAVIALATIARLGAAPRVYVPLPVATPKPAPTAAH